MVAADCNVAIFDELQRTRARQADDDLTELSSVRNFNIPHRPRPDSTPEDLITCLNHRDRRKTRWIMVTGWAQDLMTELSRRMLDGHGCLDLGSLEENNLGGPIKCDDGSYFVWVQTIVWSVTQTDGVLSVARCSLRIVVCLPMPTTAGTIITHLSGANLEAVDRVKKALAALLDFHSMGTDAMQCVWVLAFSILHAVAEQLNSAFHVFDPLSEAKASLPHIDRMPYLLQQANDLARIERYTSRLSEIVAFLDAVRLFQQSQTSEPIFGRPSSRGEGSHIQNCHAVISPRSNLESTLVKQRIGHTQELCQTCIKQYNSILQTMLLHTGADIAVRLDKGSKVAECLAGIGLALTALSGLTSPLSLIIGYFGMNVQEFADGTSKTLFDFWQAALPIMAVSVGVLSLILIRLFSGSKAK